MIRVLVLALLAANLLFFAWTALVGDDRPQLQAAPAGPRTAPLPPEPPPACTTVGPFDSAAAAERPKLQLEGAGWGVLRRDVGVKVADGYWVYVAGLTSVADQNRVLRALRRTGIQDAFVMPEDPEFRVSVGIFSDQRRAEDRAQRVRALELDAQVTERMRDATTTWLDVPGVAPATLTERLAAAGIALGNLEPGPCPAPEPVPTPGV